ncbi:PRD domain-containing protein [Proteiniclasticum sp. SCR006]|uniref:PRD domain-containing protein n=1 Tax=Proteiniclasticum aestuarii TaxID=2817862 RepID=A0A939KGD7_9CLOT|nr:PRD domain-containing protein [Proteiniclasticum aestuarii]MBO1265407.1 PRD domain-containing protein [Proteiniclasticum aestuarii]
MDTLQVHYYDRVFYILRKMLSEEGYVKFEDLAQEIYVSLSTLNHDIKEVKRILAKFDLEILSRPHYGAHLKGLEQNKRLCISEYIFYNENIFVEQYLEKARDSISVEINDIVEVEDILRTWAATNEVVLSDTSVHDISIQIIIAMIRNKQGYVIDVEDEYINKIQEEPLYDEMKCLVEAIESFLEYKFDLQERGYFFMNIDSKRVIASSNGDDFLRDACMDNVLDAVFAEIYNNFDIDISKDTMLRRFLALHILQMIKRIRNNLTARNPMVHESLKKYLYATKVTISAVSVIEEHYSVKIPLDEFGYLLFYFNMALLNLKKERSFSIGFISSRGRAESMMYENELKSSFSNASIFRFSSLEEAEAHHHMIDLAVSVSPIKSNILSRIVSVEDGNHLMRIQETLERLDLYTLEVQKYFKPEFFLRNITGSSRTEVLTNIYEKLKGLGVIEENYPRKLPFVSHEVGNRAVHIQDLYKYLRKEVCLVAVLEKPIYWERSVVEVLFLIKTKKDGDKDLFILCDLFSAFFSDKSRVNRLISEGDYKEFMEDYLQY